MKQLFVTATRQNDGKTMVSTGLFNSFKRRFSPIGYMKPVGQQYRIVDGEKIDKDAVLFKNVYDLSDLGKDISPIAVEKGFTENYIDSPRRDELAHEILDAHKRVSDGKEFLLIEGTGHAGVGSVFDMSNADVAHIIGSKVLMVSLGGIGRSIDEIMLNKACFDKLGVEMIGVVINKVLEDKFDKVDSFVRKGLKYQGIDVLGTIPFVRMLQEPNLLHVIEQLKPEVLFEGSTLNRKINRVVIGAMQPHDAMDYFTKDTLLILPASNEGLIMAAVFGDTMSKVKYSISGIIFTGGIKPHNNIMSLVQHANIPVLLAEGDSYAVTTKINNMMVKVKEQESDKIQKIQELVEKYVDVDEICNRLG